MSQPALLFIAGAALALTGSLATTLLYQRLTRSTDGDAPELKRVGERQPARAKAVSLEDLRRVSILLLMVPFNPFLLLGKTLALGYKTRTGLLYLVFQSCWYVTLIAYLGDRGWLLAGFAVGLHCSAILLGWDFYLREEW